MRSVLLCVLSPGWSVDVVITGYFSAVGGVAS